MKDLSEIKRVAIEAAGEAGRYILGEVEKHKDISHKQGVNNLVTNVDKTSETMIIDKIRVNFPEHSILAEESGEHVHGDGIKWVIDPLDGTTNFAHAFPFFCVSIGVMVEGAAKVGVVYDPSRDEMFCAEEGKGAFLNDKQIHVSDVTTVQDALIATGFAYTLEGKIANIDNFEIMLGKAQAVRRAGSAAIDLCYVACGRFDGFWEKGLSPWDTAAGYLIVKEAGGTVTQLDGSPFDIYTKNILATNTNTHQEMISLLG